MTLPALVGVYTISVNSEKSATDENGGNGMDRWGVGCVTWLKIVKIVKMVLQLCSGLYSPSENGENDMGTWGGGVYHGWK